MAISPMKRSDISQSLVHLTRERKEYEPVNDICEPQKLHRIVPAFDVLKEIMTSGTIRGSGNDGFVKGRQKAVCLSEIPLSAVGAFASAPSESRAKYRFYGVALSKKTAFELGGRPVIYLPDSEATWIPDDQKWRQVRYEFGAVDWTHEREWRVPGDLDLAKAPGIYLLVWSASEAAELQKFDSPISKLVRGILPMEHLTTML